MYCQEKTTVIQPKSKNNDIYYVEINSDFLEFQVRTVLKVRLAKLKIEKYER